MKDRSGQTLIELIAAAFVLAVGLVGVLALTTANVRNQTIGNIRLVGSQLAREGVELARNIRDTNWIQVKEWDDGLKGATPCAVIADTVDQFHQQFRFVECSDQLYLDLFAIYRLDDRLVQLQTPPQDAVKTEYYRKITFDPICVDKNEAEFIEDPSSVTSDAVVAQSVDCGERVKAGIQVTSEVGWRRAATTQSTKVVEQIYNWR
ncbi:prepilin-type N-terminal cleavage/methylation domain-containing protein [Candidatus Uhrbacteria bacterium]|nr:prepilin-type N-terminal cleavage/methylation domain-containing protein [Candidatus Uhrbacteria bacterium]